MFFNCNFQDGSGRGQSSGRTEVERFSSRNACSVSAWSELLSRAVHSIHDDSALLRPSHTDLGHRGSAWPSEKTALRSRCFEKAALSFDEFLRIRLVTFAGSSARSQLMLVSISTSGLDIGEKTRSRLAVPFRQGGTPDSQINQGFANLLGLSTTDATTAIQASGVSPRRNNIKIHRRNLDCQKAARLSQIFVRNKVYLKDVLVPGPRAYAM